MTYYCSVKNFFQRVNNNIGFNKQFLFSYINIQLLLYVI